MPQRKLLLFLLPCLVFCFTAKAEEITLKSGQKIKGNILSRDGQSMKVALDGASVTYYLEDVDSIDGKSVSGRNKEDNQTEALIDQAKQLLNDNQPSQVVDILKKQVNAGLKNAKVYYYLGQAQRLLKDYDSAISSYQESINLDSMDYAAFLGIGLSYRDSDDTGKALIFLNKAKELKPDEPQIFFAIGNLYIKTQEYAMAEDNLNKAIKLNYEYWIARFNLANVYTATGKYKEAIDQYWIYIKNAGEDPQAYLNLSQAYIGIGDKDDALAALLAARELYKKAPGSENMTKLITQMIIKIQAQTPPSSKPTA